MSILLDHPTRAKTTAPNPLLLVPLVLALREVLERRGEITAVAAAIAAGGAR